MENNLGGISEMFDVAEKMIKGFEARFVVSQAIGEYSTEDFNEVLDVMASNIARTITEEFINNEAIRKEFFPNVEVSAYDLKLLTIILYQRVVDQLKEEL